MHSPDYFKTLLAGTLLLVALALCAAPSFAEDEIETGWRLRVSLAGINFDHADTGGKLLCTGRYVCRGYRTTIDAGGGLGLNAEYRFSRRFGLDLGALAGGGVDLQQYWVDIPGAAFVHDTVTFSALSAGLDVHLTPKSRADLFIGPLLALVQYGGLEMRTDPGRVVARLDLDDDVGIGAVLGVGVPFGKERRWLFHASLTYIDTSLDGASAVGRVHSNYDMTLYGLGLGYRF